MLCAFDANYWISIYSLLKLRDDFSVENRNFVFLLLSQSIFFFIIANLYRNFSSMSFA